MKKIMFIILILGFGFSIAHAGVGDKGGGGDKKGSNIKTLPSHPAEDSDL